MRERFQTMKQIVSLLLLLLLAGCAVGGVDVEQEQAMGLVGEVLDGRTVGQTFQPQYDGFYRLDLYTATYGRENTHPVIFRVKAAPDALDDLVRMELAPAEISNSGPTIITFPSLAGTAGGSLYFSVESPGSVPGDAISVYQNEGDVYPGGEMYVDGLPGGGDLAFIAYTQETFTFADVWGDFYSRASQDKPFFAFYCSLLALILVALGVSLALPRRVRPGDGESGMSNGSATTPDSADDAITAPGEER